MAWAPAKRLRRMSWKHCRVTGNTSEDAVLVAHRRAFKAGMIA